MQNCTLCSRSRMDGNLWCQEKACPAENAPALLVQGAFLANMEILNIEARLPTATVYRVERLGEVVWLKVAHAGYEEKLKREARFLQQHTHPSLPTLLPAHAGLATDAFPYGRSGVNGRLLTYYVMQAHEGKTVRELLQRNEQPWFQTGGWLVATLADLFAFLHASDLYHFALAPELIFVRFDQKGIPRPILLDLGVASTLADSMRYWQPAFCVAGYAPPEYQNPQQSFGTTTDVFGLGTILFELLHGKRWDQAVADRSDLARLPDIAVRATAIDWGKRPLHITDFAQELLATIPTVPREIAPRQGLLAWTRLTIFILLSTTILLWLTVLITT